MPNLFSASDLFGYLDVAKIAYVTVEQYYVPDFPMEIISQSAGERLLRNSHGVLLRERRGGVSMPQFLEYPIKNRADYAAYRERLTGSPEKRCRADLDDQVRFISGQERDIVATHMEGFFGYPRELSGLEHLLTMFYDDPALMHAIIDDHLELLLALFEPLIRDLRPDFAFIWEDRCYKNGPLIAPRTFREFMLPAYQRLTRFLRQMGLKNIIVDSDGSVDKLIPLWLKGGVTGHCLLKSRPGGCPQGTETIPPAPDHRRGRKALPGTRASRNRRGAYAGAARHAGAGRLRRLTRPLGPRRDIPGKLPLLHRAGQELSAEKIGPYGCATHWAWVGLNN